MCFLGLLYFPVSWTYCPQFFMSALKDSSFVTHNPHTLTLSVYVPYSFHHALFDRLVSPSGWYYSLYSSQCYYLTSLPLSLSRVCNFLIFKSCFFGTWSMNFCFFTHVSPHVWIVSRGNEDTLRLPSPVWESSLNPRTIIPFYLQSHYLGNICTWMPTDISDLKRMHNSWPHPTPDMLLFLHPHLPNSVNISLPFSLHKIYALRLVLCSSFSCTSWTEFIETSSQGQTSNCVPN